MFNPTTCVGLGYGRRGSLFLAASGHARFARGLGSGRRLRPLPRVRGPRRFYRRRGSGMFNRFPSGSPRRVALRCRLTLIRRALIRNPWSFGGRVSRPPYRYSYLHLLFHALQQRSSSIFNAHGMLPYHPSRIHGFGTGFMPDYYPRRIARLVSCYALFK